MATDRRAEVTWQGDLMSGSGTIERVESGAVEALRISWPSRAEEPAGNTSPEELIAAAHGSCFSMALSHALAQAGHEPEQLSVATTVTFQPGTGITRSAIEVEGSVPGMDEEEFRRAADEAKDNCPVSKALAGNVEMTVTARLRAPA